MEQKEESHLCLNATQDYCVMWNYRRRSGCSNMEWRRIQVKRFLSQYTEFRSKPSKVLAWINSHEPNPWNDCNRNKLCKMMKRLPLEPDSVRVRYSLIRNIAEWDVLPVFPM